METRKTAKTYSPEVRERDVRMVTEHQGEHASPWAAICSIAAKIGCRGETLRGWVRQAERARRYEAEGADALGDQRRGNPGAKPLLTETDLEALRERLKTPPDDGGLWSGPKVARWIAARRGLEHVHAPRGWEALQKLGWSLQVPRPKNPRAAPPDEQAAFKKSSPTPSRRRPVATPARRSRSGPPTSTGSA